MAKQNNKPAHTAPLDELSKMLNSLPKDILIRGLKNYDCIKCHVVERDMFRIGAFVMCPHCASVEFGKDASSIDLNSDAYKITYHKWLKKYQQQ